MVIQKVLIVDDEELVREFLEETLKRKELDVRTAKDGKEALKIVQETSFDLVITDMRMPGLTGIELLKEIKKISPQTIVIVITAFASVENAVEAMRLGAYNYILKPFSPDTIEALIERANEHLTIVSENSYLREQASNKNRHSIIAESPQMKKILQEIEQIAKSHANVLITGESGTGKEEIAHLIYNNSFRNSSPYIKVNCAAIPETLIESEFFGHEKGAFTGATSKRLGRFELADKGTLLLDEVTEVPLLLQAKLLRAVQEQEFERIGGTKPIKVDVRILSTSNRNMSEALQQKLIREDLYYRLNVIPIHIPPLRERKEDILPLARFFVERARKENRREKKELAKDAEELLLKYPWPGNIRELANIIERAVVLDTNEKITARDLQIQTGSNEESSLPTGVTLHELEKRLIIETLQKQNQNRTKTAEVLGISVRTLRNKLHEYNLTESANTL